MNDFQRRLYEDLQNKVRDLSSMLDAAAVDPECRRHALDIKRALTQIDQSIQKVIDDPAFGRPELARQHRRTYQALAQNVNFIIEANLVPQLVRFSTTDRRLTRMVAKLGQQINWPMPTPLVVADSSQYYMTYPSFQLMKVPASEDTNVLAYPDLIHEMTHILLTRERARMLGDFGTVFTDYVAKQRAAGTPLSQEVVQRWANGWLEEYMCDMVAVFVTGPTFGYQHVRLIWGMPSRAYGLGPSHPPDESRVRATMAVLRAMGKNAEAQSVEALWQEYAPTLSENKPADYDRSFPDEVLQALADRVVNGCQQLQLRPFDAPSVRQPDDVVGMIVEGWQRFRSNVAGFTSWQSARLKLLWRQLGIDDAPPQVAAAARTWTRSRQTSPNWYPIRPAQPAAGVGELAA